ncbi:MAG TPA: hypothetical protein VED18_12085, partial [Candidatus Sulfotelmatobacter sp.]|nr:hypothetical protein [Candidatus Sulfotelmatobacter sp.]
MRPVKVGSCSLCLVGLLLMGGGAWAGEGRSQPLTLTAVGAPRQLPERILGASAEPLIEHLIDDPRKIAAIKQTAPAVLRFPGGSQANYYDWRTGLLSFPARSNSSAYMKFWAAIAPKIARGFPNGVRMEEYAPFAREVGADVILVPNLETSSVQEQTAWFQQLAAAGALPKLIELGNEFYIAMGGDPAVMRQWPDALTSMGVMHRYESALRPIVGPGAKFAVQSAASAFWVDPRARGPFPRRMLQWDADLQPADWFEAVTVHLYPFPRMLAQQPGGGTPEGLFRLLMGRGDEGVDRVLMDVARRLPGKEIWITEWNARGGEAWDPQRPDLVTPAISAHVVARTTLAFLRHPAVTRALYFMLHLGGSKPFLAYLPDGAGGFRPLPETVMVEWFDHAANGGATFQRLVEAGAEPQRSGPGSPDRYREVEGGLFKVQGRVTVILQNPTGMARRYDPT